MLARGDERAVVIRKPLHIEESDDGDQQERDPAERDAGLSNCVMVCKVCVVGFGIQI